MTSPSFKFAKEVVPPNPTSAHIGIIRAECASKMKKMKNEWANARKSADYNNFEQITIWPNFNVITDIFCYNIMCRKCVMINSYKS